MDQEVEAVAWTILQALHENIPESERPASWSDLRGDQEQRIRTAAVVGAIECIRARDRQPRKVTFADLEELLKDRPDDPPIHINPDGSIDAMEQS